MRPIKLRAWHKYNNGKSAPYMVYFDLYDLVEGKLEVEGKFMGFLSSCEVMQFTRLLDKNGKEIFEGDIVKDVSHSDLVFTVKWDEKKAGYYMPNEFDEEYAYSIAEPELEVIGNIYENSELLNGQ